MLMPLSKIITPLGSAQIAADYGKVVMADAPDFFVRVSGGAIVDATGNHTFATGGYGGEVGLTVDAPTGVKAMTFNGTNFVYGDPTLGSGAGDWPVGRKNMTLELWYRYARPAVAVYEPIMAGWGYAYCMLLASIHYGAGRLWCQGYADASTQLWSPDIYDADNAEWHHLCYVQDSENSIHRIYRDGVQIISGPITHDGSAPATCNARFAIGQPVDDNVYWYSGTSQGWVGEIADVAVYPLALGADRVLAHYKTAADQLTKAIQRLAPIAHWPLDTLEDISGNGRNLTQYVGTSKCGFTRLYPGGPAACMPGGWGDSPGYAWLQSPAFPKAYFEGNAPCSFVIIHRSTHTGEAVWRQNTVTNPWEGIGYELWKQPWVGTQGAYLAQRNMNGHGYVIASPEDFYPATSFFVVTFDNAGVKVYLNGVLYNNDTIGRNYALTYPSDPAFIIGYNIYGGLNSLSSNFAVFDRALSQAEVTALNSAFIGA